jgi:hypothetical protein
MTLLLMLTVYLLIFSDYLPPTTNDNTTLGQLLVIENFIMAILITLATIILTVFTGDNVKNYKLP